MVNLYDGKQRNFIGDIRILDGHISEIGAHLEQLEDEDVLDATNKYVYPGLVEAHCHLGMEESSIRMEGMMSMKAVILLHSCKSD